MKKKLDASNGLSNPNICDVTILFFTQIQAFSILCFYLDKSTLVSYFG